MRRTKSIKARRNLLPLAVSVAALLKMSTPAKAAILYWDGADSGANAQGGAGTWTTTTPTNWDTLAFGGADSGWTSGDTAVFGGTVGTVTVGAGGVTVGGLRFDTNSYVIDASTNALTFGAGNDLIGFSGVSGATITGSVGGPGNVTTKMVNPLVGTTLTNFTLTLNGTSTGGWSGTTTVGNLSTLSLAQSNQALLNTSGITLNGGNITLTNAGAATTVNGATSSSTTVTVASATGITVGMTVTGTGISGAPTVTNVSGTTITLSTAQTLANSAAIQFAETFNRVSDSAPITSNGGTITYTNTAGAGIVYAETIGKVTASSGQLNIFLSTNQNGAGTPTNKQTLTLGDSVTLGPSGVGLAQSGTSNIVFGSAGNLSTSTNIIRVYGITSSTPAGQIIGPWATVGTSAGFITDFAKYTSDGTYGTITAAATTNTAEINWTADSNKAYSNSEVNVTLTDNRTMAGLRFAQTNTAIALGNFRLETYAILHVSANGSSISSSGTGYLTTPSGGGNLFINGNSNGFTISVPIKDAIDNGAVTVVKIGTGSSSTNLSGILSNSGGVVLNSSALTLGNSSNTFKGGVFISGGATLTASADGNLGDAANKITFNGNGTLAFSNNVTYARELALNNGAIASIGNSSGNISTTISKDVTGSGGLAMNSSSSVQVNFTGTGNTFEGPVLIGSSGTTTQAYRFQFSSLTDSTTANGRIVFAASAVSDANGSVFQYNGTSNLTLANRVIEIASTGATPTSFHQIRSSGAGTLSINTDLLVTSTAAQTLSLGGTNFGNNTFGGKISNGNSSALSVLKADAGTWILSGSNTYTGGTTITTGKLIFSGANSLPATGTVAVGANGILSLQDSGGAVARNSTVPALTLTSLGSLAFDWTGDGTGDQLTSTAGINPTASSRFAINLNVTGTHTNSPTLTLLTGVGSSTLSSSSFYLANLTNYTATLTNNTGNTLVVGNYATATPLTTFYWIGNKVAAGSVAGVDNAWALSTGGTNGSNWSTNETTYAGTALTPGSTANVIFSNAAMTGKGNQSGVLGADVSVNSVTIDDSVAVTIAGANGATLTLNSSSGTAGTPASPGSAISVTSNSNAAVAISANVILGANQTWNVASGKTLTVSGIVSGGFSLTKADAGTLSLSGANTYTGVTTINKGTVQISNANALGTTAGNTIIAATGSTSTGGQLQLGNGIDCPENITITGSTETSGNAGAIIGTANTTVTLSGNITLSNLTGGVRIATNLSASRMNITGNISQVGSSQGLVFATGNSGGQTITVSNPIALNGGNLSITGNGSATILKGVNATDGTGIGNTTINSTGAGIQLGIDNAINITGTLSVDGGAFNLAGFNQTVNALTSTSTGGTVQNTVAGTKTLTVGNGGGSGTYSGTIVTGTGDIQLIKTGVGTQTLSNAANTYGGKTTVQAGTLAFSTGNAVASANQSLGTNAAVDLGITSNVADATLQYTGGAGTLAKNINVVGTGSFKNIIQNSGTGLLTLTGTLTKAGTVLVLKGGTQGITISGTGTIVGTNGVLHNSDLIIDGGTTTLATANTYDGPTSIINGATLNANVTDALPTTNGRTAVFIDQTVSGTNTGSGSSTLALGASQSIASLSGQGTTGTSVVNLNANTLTIGTTSGSTTFAGNINGTNGSLIKDGASTQVLSGSNGYTGSTTVAASGGTLEVRGSLSGTTAVTVNTGGTLLLNSGTSNIINSTTPAAATLGGGTVAFGNAANQVQNFGSLTLSVNSTLDFGSGTSGNDTFRFTGFGTHTGGVLTIDNWNGNLSGSTNDGDADRLVFNASLSAINSFFGTSDISFTGYGSGWAAIDLGGGTSYEIVPVPEPATTALIGAVGLCALIGYRERRRFCGTRKSED